MLSIFKSFILSLLILCTFSASAKMDFFTTHSYSSQRTTNSPSDKQENRSHALNKIMHNFSQWKGVRYKFGGTSRSGIDCSAYMQRVFMDVFSINLPRTTGEQIKLGSHITKNNLHAGDLVFFKTSPQTRHVGVYIGNGKFIHASSSMGVTVSRLDNKYWDARYELARRINNSNA